MIINIVSWALTGALAVVLIALLLRYFYPQAEKTIPLIADKYHKRRNEPASLKSVIIEALLLFALSRALLALTALGSAYFSSDYSRLDIFSWVKWDANHYVGLAENWYVNEGDPRFHIVFFPLYPGILRLGKLLCGWDARVFGIVFSNLCLIASCPVLYRLAESEYGPSRARLSARLFMFSPVTFFFSLPFSESLFFLLTVSCVYAARKKKFAGAIILGALASATRLLGLLCAVAIFYEFIRGKSGLKPSAYIKYALATCLVAAGFLAYLYLNYAVTGSPLTFLQYQREHWSQRMGSVGNTVKYTLENALRYDDMNLRLGTWIPQSVSIISVILLLCLAFRGITASDGAYAILYIWFALSPTWLLSGVRYLSAMYPAYLMTAAVFNGEKRGRIAVILSAAGVVYMTGLFFAGSVM